MPAPGFAGYECTLQLGGNVIAYGRDVDLDASATEIDKTTRNSAGWREKSQGLKEWSADVGQLWVPDNVGLQAIRDAYFSGAELAFRMLDQDGNGFSGTVFVSGIKFPQPLDDAVEFPATLVGTGALTVVTASS